MQTSEKIKANLLIWTAVVPVLVWCGFPILSFIHLLFLCFSFEKGMKSLHQVPLSHISYWVSQQKRPLLDSSWVPLFIFFSIRRPIVFFFLFFSSTQQTAEKKQHGRLPSYAVTVFFSPWSAAYIFLPTFRYFFQLDGHTMYSRLSMCTYKPGWVCTHSLIMGQDSTHTHNIHWWWWCFFFVVVASFCFCFDWPALCCCCCCCLVRVRASAAHETQRLSCGFHMEQKKKRKQDTQIIIIMIIIIMEREREGGAMVHALLIFCFCFYFGSFWSCFFLWWSNSVAARE